MKIGDILQSADLIEKDLDNIDTRLMEIKDSLDTLNETLKSFEPILMKLANK